MGALIISQDMTLPKDQSQPLDANKLTDLFYAYREETNVFKKEKIRDQIVIHNQRLISSVAKRYVNILPYTSLDFNDLVQEGNLGLIRAIQDYDPDLGYAFSTYATHWIREYIGRCIANNGNTIRIPVHMIEKIRKVKNVMNEFKEQYGRIPSDKELSALTGFMEPELDKIQYYTSMTSLVSLSAPVNFNDNSDIVMEDVIDARDTGHENVLENMSKKDLEEKLKRLLNKKEYDIICRRLALGLYDQCWTLQEIGKVYGVSRERIRQVEASAMKKIKRRLKYVLG